MVFNIHWIMTMQSLSLRICSVLLIFKNIITKFNSFAHSEISIVSESEFPGVIRNILPLHVSILYLWQYVCLSCIVYVFTEHRFHSAKRILAITRLNFNEFMQLSWQYCCNVLVKVSSVLHTSKSLQFLLEMCEINMTI